LNNNILNLFPQANEKINGKKLIYLDSAATTLKYEPAVKRIYDFYMHESSNVHRGAHFLSYKATENFEKARSVVKKFINANSENEIIFTRGTTESINLVANHFRHQLMDGGKILLTELEHHSNIVPWQLLASENPKIQIEFVKINNSGDLDFEDLKSKLNSKPDLLSFTACSNVLGTINSVKEICGYARQCGVLTFVDAAQSVANRKTDVKDWNCDFLAFSGHKIFAPFGIGVLYGKENLLNKMQPYQGGGSMIETVNKKGSTFLGSPHRFEAGTPNVGGALSLAVALDFLLDVGFNEIQNHESKLLNILLSEIQTISGLKTFGTPKERANIVSFQLEGAHHSDIAVLLDQQGVAIRSGHHCCQVLMESLNVTGTARASLSIYTTEKDIDALISGIKKAKELL
jgi:cysteine desulfurase/selenocysteine lyase